MDEGMLRRDRSCLVMVDMQERLLPVIEGGERVVAHGAILLRAARALAVPIIATEQYAKGLGPTVPALAALVPAFSPLDKLTFACTGDPGFRTALDRTACRQVVLFGIEAHVCVLQTALGLKARGQEVAVVADAVASRAPANRDLAIARMRQAGIAIVSTEMVVFEWMERAGTDEFRAVSRLIR